MKFPFTYTGNSLIFRPKVVERCLEHFVSKTMDLENPSYFSIIGETQNDLKPKMGNTDSVSLSESTSTTLKRQLTPTKNQRINLRYLRSVSSNSADSNQELLIMGEPRLSDIDPDLAVFHQQQHHHHQQQQQQQPASRSNSLKTTKIDHDRLYCALPTNSDDDDDDDDVITTTAELSGDEVFLNEDTARYYNYSALKNQQQQQQRRHSISTFISGGSYGGGDRDRSNSITSSSSKSFKEDFPQAIIHATSDGEAVIPPILDDHHLKHGSYPRKRCPRCVRGTLKKSTNMDDILIVALKRSEAAKLWVDYFASYFQQISKQANRKPFKIQYLWIEDCLNDTDEIVEKRTSVKLQLVVLCPAFLEFIAEYAECCRHLSKTFLSHRTLALLLGVTDNDLNENHKRVLPTYPQWQRLSVGQDQDENFTKEFLGQAVAILSRVWKQQTSVTSSNHPDKSGFSVSPKKIRQGQNSVFILLTQPLQRDDQLKVSVERNNEIYEIKSVKRRNPYTVKIAVPDTLTEITAIVNILVEKNGDIVGSRPIKCESRLRELEQILRFTNNPIEFMCQTLGFNPANKEQLDNWLLQAFQKNLPSHFNLLANHMTPFGASMRAHKHSHEEYPTLLHFAAKFGFEKLAIQLLDCPGGDIAYDIKNVFDMTPAEIAEANGHTHLATTLRGYMNMNEFTNMYTKLKEMTVDENSYLTPKFIEELYKTCPAPRPVIIDNTTNLPVIPPMDPQNASGYMTMKTTDDFSLKQPNKENCNDVQKQSQQPPQQQSKNCELAEDRFQKELLEIMNDFKNNVHSITQVEKLVDEWKNRNDVQKSFKEKQEQLNQMRLKYEQIQYDMKTTMKKSTTPFERIKKLFNRNHKSHRNSNDDDHNKQNISSPILQSPSIIAIQSQRPISSLSTSSSGSSGRMSTISGCSFGDSGTHSDNEERKHIFNNQDDDFRNELNKAVLELNYTPVPAPKPIKPGMFLNRNKLFETIEEKPLQRPDTLPVNEEYYIQFPPSGLPVSGVVDDKKNTTPDQDYMNVVSSPNVDENREYMNFKIVTNR